MVHKLRVPIRTATSVAFTRRQLQLIADAINGKAKDRRLLGQIESPVDGKTRFDRATHYVLPDAKVRGSSIHVSIAVVDNQPGRMLKALIEGGVHMRGSIRGFMLGYHPGNSVTGIDIDMSTDPDFTALDAIVEAMEDE